MSFPSSSSLSPFFYNSAAAALLEKMHFCRSLAEVVSLFSIFFKKNFFPHGRRRKGKVTDWSGWNSSEYEMRKGSEHSDSEGEIKKIFSSVNCLGNR